LQDDEAGLDALLLLPAAEVDTVERPEGSFHVPRAPGWSLRERPGRPVTLERTFLVALPPWGDPEVSWSAEEVRSRPGLRVPVTVQELARGVSAPPAGVADGDPWTEWRGARWPESWVEIGEPFRFRFQRLLPVTVRLWRAGGGRAVEELAALRLQVRWSERGRMEGRPVPPGEAGALAPVLNPHAARRWLWAPRTARRQGDHLFAATANPWLRIQVRRRGLYALEYEDLVEAGYPADEVELASLRLFASDQMPLPEDVDVEDLPAWIPECAVWVEDGDVPGQWDPGDRVYFVANGPDGWRQDRGASDAGFERYVNHPYAEKGVYWLTWGGSFPGEPRRMAERDGDPGGLEARQTGVARLHLEENYFYDPRPKDPDATWEKFWYQEALARESGTEYRFVFSAPRVVAGTAAKVRARYFGASWGNQGVYPDHILVAKVNGAVVDSVMWEGLERKDLQGEVTTLAESDNVFHYRPVYVEDPGDTTRIDKVYLAWVEVDYPCRLVASDDSLEFFAPEGLTGPVAWRVDGFSLGASPVAIQATDPWAPYLIRGAVEETAEGRAFLFADTLASGAPAHYVVLDPSRAARPADLTPVRPEEGWLRDRQGPVDAIIVTHESLLPAARELAAFRDGALPGIPGGRVAVVTTQEIYDEFSWGLTDVTAIRNFLEYAYNHWGDLADPTRRPFYVTFFGDPYYDMRNYLKEGGVLLVPNYPNYYDATYRYSKYTPQYSSDEWLTLFEPSRERGLHLAAGRIPVADLSTAQALVAKIQAYETSAPQTWWKTRVAFLADDICQGLLTDGLGYAHTRQTEGLVDDALPTGMVPERLYLIEYGSECRYPTKPQATEDLLRLMDEGVLIVNYIGHGSEGQLADERLFELSRVSSLRNDDVPFLFVNASCSVGKHDIPGLGLAEALLIRPRGGAIASFAPSSVATSQANAAINRLFFGFLFPGYRPANARSVGEAGLLSRVAQAGITNSQRYVVLGDAATVPAVPRLEIDLAFSVPGQGEADTLKRGMRVELVGSIRDTAGAVMENFDGLVSLRMFDSEVKRHPTGLPGDDYELLGAPIFRGEIPVQRGRFALDLVIPVALRGGDRGWAKVFAYAWDGQEDAMGSLERVWIQEEVVLAQDREGPTIQVRSSSGDSLLAPGDELWISIADTSGINITGLVGSRSVVLRIDDLAGRPLVVQDLAPSITFQGTAQEVELRVPVPSQLEEGRSYVARVAASDNLNNRSEAAFRFRLVGGSGAGLQLGRVFNVPNPTDGPTTFFLEVNETVDVEIQIFTARGRRIQRLFWSAVDPARLGERGLSWDGRDAEGDRLANGVYFYKVKVTGVGSGQRRSRIERLAVLR
jgi:hypothetical protein